ncbi:MAG: hypothetical protein VZS44_06355 [Bacilli bacterium]|nr:hypothetical protein [Bacilli bacterium]
MNDKILENLVNTNPEIEQKEYMIRCLNLLEKIIPDDCKENIYRNIKSLKAILNIDIDLSNTTKDIVGYARYTGYDIVNNSLVMDEKTLKDLWKKAKMHTNPKDYYWKYYLQILLYELSRMASSKYDKETDTFWCGFDKYPATSINDKNKGLTKGLTEIISMELVLGTNIIFSECYIEICLINQLIQLVGKEVFLKSYFSNKGTKLLEQELNKIIYNPTLASYIFKNIEINYNIRMVSEQHSILGSIQLTLLKYLDVKINELLIEEKYEDVSKLISNYEKYVITLDKLQLIGEDYTKYIGLERSIIRFNEIKEKYDKHLNGYSRKLIIDG